MAIYTTFSPPSAGATVQQFPAVFLANLGSLDQAAVAKQWAAAMSTAEHTHAVTGVRLSDGWTASEAQAILERLVALARQASAGQRMYLLVEA